MKREILSYFLNALIFLIFHIILNRIFLHTLFLFSIVLKLHLSSLFVLNSIDSILLFLNSFRDYLYRETLYFTFYFLFLLLFYALSCIL
jgi:TM2 domain-containing membrane protein YozV